MQLTSSFLLLARTLLMLLLVFDLLCAFMCLTGLGNVRTTTRHLACRAKAKLTSVELQALNITFFTGITKHTALRSRKCKLFLINSLAHFRKSDVAFVEDNQKCLALIITPLGRTLYFDGKSSEITASRAWTAK